MRENLPLHLFKGVVRLECGPLLWVPSTVLEPSAFVKVLAPTLPKVAAVPKGTLVIRVLREDRL